MAAFPSSGEINSKLAQPVEAINRVEQHFSREALAVDRTDGISMTFADWRFNLRLPHRTGGAVECGITR